MKWTRHRCQLAPTMTARMAFIRRGGGRITSCTPPRPRSADREGTRTRSLGLAVSTAQRAPPCAVGADPCGDHDGPARHAAPLPGRPADAPCSTRVGKHVGEGLFAQARVFERGHVGVQAAQIP